MIYHFNLKYELRAVSFVSAPFTDRFKDAMSADKRAKIKANTLTRIHLGTVRQWHNFLNGHFSKHIGNKPTYRELKFGFIALNKKKRVV